MFKRLALGTAVVAALAPALHGQGGPWGQVKSWSGTVTVMATDDSAKRSYSATGPVTLSDDMMPAGMHAQWPMPGAAVMQDPTKAANAFKTWQAHVVYTHRVLGKDELGQAIDGTCKLDDTRSSIVQLVVITTGTPGYRLVIDSPSLDKVPCTGQRVGSDSYSLPKKPIEFMKPLPAAAGPLTSTESVAFGSTVLKVTWNLTPQK